MSDEATPPAATPTPGTPGSPGAPGTFSHGELKGALKAFKKRLRAMKLDSESGKITGPLSSGRSSAIQAITPPAQFPKEIWEELVKMGKLRYEGYGTYELLDVN